MSLFGIHELAVSPQGDWASVERAADQLAEHNIRLIEVPLGQPGRNNTQRLADFAARNGFTLFPSLNLPATLDIEADMQEALDYLEGIFRDCTAIGAPRLGGLLYGAQARAEAAGDAQKMMDAICRFLERAAQLARGSGLELAVEPASRFVTSAITRASDAVAVIERVGAENLFVALNSFAMQTEENSFTGAFETAEPFLRYVRVSESHGGLPGQGMMDWKALFSAADAIGYRDAVTLHVARGPRIKAVRLEELLEDGLPFMRAQAAETGFNLG